MPHHYLSPAISAHLAREIRGAGGREVNFACEVDAEGVILAVRVLARGTADRVLALPGAFAPGQIMLHNHPNGVLEPSQADLHVASSLADNGVGFGIINNDGDELFVVVEVPKARKQDPIDALAVVDLLGEAGPVHQVLGSYEDRPSQRDMAAYIADGYNDGGALLLEAGTGVGKSFAYLVPAIEWAMKNKERTIVSTATITLQEQLVAKDLPLLAEALARGDRVPTFALLKGWRNYLCLNRLKSAGEAQGSLLEPEKHDELVRITGWAARTADGSLADLPAPPTPEVWDEVSAEADLCPRLECTCYSKCVL
ncbi:MAG TPA: JAB domain-containing protein, partial [Gemmatimonadales bacterium]|nr:JAB domain-containing protein [Gemmatimonadales bacterium]